MSILRGTQEQWERQPARHVPDFAKSTGKRNGRLFTGKSIFKVFRSDGSERAYSTANIFKQIFIFVIAAVLCFLSLMAFEAANTRIENKVLDSDSVYVNMNTYTDLRTLDTSLYENIDFFETQYKQGSFRITKSPRFRAYRRTMRQKRSRRTIRRRASGLSTARCRKKGRCSSPARSPKR